MKNWWWLLASIPAILILRIAGFIGDFWTGLGIVALLAFLAVLEMFPVAVRRYIALFFVGWAVLFLVLPYVRNAFLSSRPLTREALEEQHRALDLLGSELSRPSALTAKESIAGYCRELEEVRGEQLRDRLRHHLELERIPPYGPYGVSVEGTYFMMAAVLEQIEKDREECRRILFGGESGGVTRAKSWWLQPVKWLWVLGITGAILLSILLFLQRRVWAFATLLAAILAAGWYLSRGQEIFQPVKAAERKAVDLSPEPSIESIKEITRIRLLGEDHQSEDALRPGQVPSGWHYYFEGPPEAKIFFEDGTSRLITEFHGGKGGIRRFSGPEGSEVKVLAFPPG